jgi:glycosyltransferase involved in cell wall biosynthesis
VTGLRILHVIPSVAATDGGPSHAIAVMERALTAAGVEVTTATTDHGLPAMSMRDRAALPEAGATRVVRIYFHKWTNFYKVAPGIIPYLWANIRTFDVVHIHALFSFATIAAGIIARLRHVPYVVRPLGTLSTYGMTQRRPWLKRLALCAIDGPILRSAAAVHFTSSFEQADAMKQGVVVRPRCAKSTNFENVVRITAAVKRFFICHDWTARRILKACLEP